jgi:hypothetical protein
MGPAPGVALTEAQMAQLTSDIVWLVEQTVTLADGSTTTALVPQVYLRLRPGDLDGRVHCWPAPMSISNWAMAWSTPATSPAASW